MLPLPGKPFEACVQVISHVNKERMVAFDGNVYSVPLNPVHPRLNVVVKAFVQRVVISYQGKDVAEHPALLRQGPGGPGPAALPGLARTTGRAPSSTPSRSANGATVASRSTSGTWRKLRQRFDEAQAVRRFVQVLQLHREFPAADIERAVRRALDAECFSVDGVRHLLLVQDDPPPHAGNRWIWPSRPELHQMPVQAPDLARYNQLMAQAA